MGRQKKRTHARTHRTALIDGAEVVAGLRGFLAQGRVLGLRVLPRFLNQIARDPRPKLLTPAETKSGRRREKGNTHTHIQIRRQLQELGRAFCSSHVLLEERADVGLQVLRSHTQGKHTNTHTRKEIGGPP